MTNLRIEDSSIVGGYLYITFTAFVQNDYTAATKMADKVSKLKYDILSCSELESIRTISGRADVVGREEHDCKSDFGMQLELFDHRKPLIRLLLQYH